MIGPASSLSTERPWLAQCVRVVTLVGVQKTAGGQALQEQRSSRAIGNLSASQQEGNLGRWLSRITGRIVEGYRLVMKTDSSHGNKFFLQVQEADRETVRETAY